MNLEAFALAENPQQLVPAPAERDWMESGVGRHAYKCLPLAIANTYGWQLLLNVDVSAAWNGSLGMMDVLVSCSDNHQATSNFANGIVTFSVDYVFRTPPGYHLLVTGPTNSFKDGVFPMTGVVETDWLPYSFTMNYRFTRSGEVHWKAGEPYAQIFVIKAGIQESVQPVIRRLTDDPKLASDLAEWRDRRFRMRKGLADGDPVALKTGWDRDYFVGRYANGQPTEAEHTTKMRLKAPIDERKNES